MKALKNAMWREMLCAPRESTEKEEVDGDMEDKDSKSPSPKLKKEGRSFQETLALVPRRITNKTMLQDVSVPFCFICLLHLANEKNLLIQPTREFDDDEDDGRDGDMDSLAKGFDLIITQESPKEGQQPKKAITKEKGKE